MIFIVILLFNINIEFASAFNPRGPEVRDLSVIDFQTWRSPHEIAPFSSDGCSGFIDGSPTEKSAWTHCCEIHDISYWAGVGGEEAHTKSDEDLKQCVSAAGYPNVGAIMYGAVRGMKIPNTTMPLSFRWGYGWPNVMGYRNHTLAQLESIKANLPTIMEGIVSIRIQQDFPAPSIYEVQAIGAKILELEQQVDILIENANP